MFLFPNSVSTKHHPSGIYRTFTSIGIGLSMNIFINNNIINECVTRAIFYQKNNCGFQNQGSVPYWYLLYFLFILKVVIIKTSLMLIFATTKKKIVINLIEWKRSPRFFIFSMLRKILIIAEKSSQLGKQIKQKPRFYLFKDLTEFYFPSQFMQNNE